jgi:hypothetical protein
VVECTGSYGDWGECLAVCDGGTQTRSYTVETATASDGAACPTDKESKACNTSDCAAVDCVGSYGDWGDCLVTCDGGTQSLSYAVMNLAVNGGAACPADVGSQACNTDARLVGGRSAYA